MQHLGLWARSVGAQKYWLLTLDPKELVCQILKPASIVSVLEGVPCRCLDLVALKEASLPSAPFIVDNSSATFAHCAPGQFGADIIMETLELPGDKERLAQRLYLIGIGKHTTCDDDLLSAFEQTIQPYVATDTLCEEVSQRLLVVQTAQKRISDVAQTLATYLNCHPLVSTVRYAGLKSDPFWQVSLRYLRCGFGGVVDFQLCDDSIEHYQEVIRRFNMPLASENTPFADADFHMVYEGENPDLAQDLAVYNRSISKPWLRCICSDTDELSLVLTIERALRCNSA